jgi:integrase
MVVRDLAVFQTSTKSQTGDAAMTVLAPTDRFALHAKPGPEYFDETVKGLALRVSSGGHKAWTYHFTLDGRRARVTLGSYPATSLAKARTLATEARGHVEAQKDPRRVFRERIDAQAVTVSDLVERYLKNHARPNFRSAAMIERRLEADVKPEIGAVRLSDLHKRDVNRVIDAIMARGSPAQARIVYQNLRAILRWAVARGDLDHSPMEGMRIPSVEQPRERVLSDDEIRVLWNGLPKALAKSKACQRIIKLCLVTGQRVGEISGMRRDELDLASNLWSLPGSRTKNGHPHTVPLSALAPSIIEETLAEAGDDSAIVFPCGESSLAPAAAARTIGRANVADAKTAVSRFGIAPFTAHDLRRTTLTGMARLGISPTVLGHVANHRSVTRGGITMAVYNQYSYDREKRQALELWADRLEAIVAGSGAKVVPIKGLANA